MSSEDAENDVPCSIPGIIFYAGKKLNTPQTETRDLREIQKHF